MIGPNQEMCVHPIKRKWFCSVLLRGTVVAKTLSLRAAQRSLGVGDFRHPQAIIPMLGSKPGDPHSLAKEWEGGSMWWQDYYDIDYMRQKCGESVASGGIPDSLAD